MTPDPALVGRFRAECDRLLGGEGAEQRVALAVSGGPDSMAMLALAAAAFPGQVCAATVDHGLRAESADEAAMVARQCATLGVPHATLTIDAARPGTGNLHAWAREHRYALLLRWAEDARCTALLTAHHADDQAETFLMRAARGSGVAGLAGVRATQARGSVTICRPLLAWRRADLRAIAGAAPFVDDPSNADPAFERARVRTALATLDWLDPVRVAAAAAHAAEAEDALAVMTDLLWRERAADGDLPNWVQIDMRHLPRELRRRLAKAAIRAILPGASVDNIEHLIESLEARTRAEHCGVLASSKRGHWAFRPAPARGSH